MRKYLKFLVLLLISSVPALAAEPNAPPPDPVFDVAALIATPLNPRTLKTTEKDGIVTEEIMFHSEKDGDKDVEIFGILCYPKGASKLPAFVWNQGGLYQATPYFPELGAKHGYVGLCIDFPLPGYRSTGGYGITGGLDLTPDLHKAPIYHGAVALLKAVSYLQSRPEVDKDRIGMAGSSWGGFYTTMMAGIDPRLKVASAMFGTGSLQLGNNWWDSGGQSVKHDAAERERWRTTLDPAWRLQWSKTPISWTSGTDDTFYWMPALMQSYAMAAGPKHLALLPNWNHALNPHLDEEVFAWLDTYLQGKPAFLQVTPVKVEKNGKDLVAQWSFSGPRTPTHAELILSYGEPGTWTSRYWSTLPATITDHTCTVKLPVTSTPYYISGTVVDADEFRYSTPLLYVKPTDFKLPLNPPNVTDFNGAGEWGDFEENQVTYMKLHGFGYPPVVPGGKTGKQAGQLKAGATTAISPLLYAPGVAQRLTAFLKADKPVQVTVALNGSFDARPLKQEQQFNIGTVWTPITLDYLPPNAVAGGLSVAFTVPEGATVLVDDIEFHPRTFHPWNVGPIF
jgi:dienelactone hydrolase